MERWLKEGRRWEQADFMEAQQRFRKYRCNIFILQKSALGIQHWFFSKMMQKRKSLVFVHNEDICMFNKSIEGSGERKRMIIDEDAFESNQPRNKPPDPAPQTARVQGEKYRQHLEGLSTGPCTNTKSSRSREREDLEQLVLPANLKLEKLSPFGRDLSHSTLVNLKVLPACSLDEKCDRILKSLYKGESTCRTPIAYDHNRRLSISSTLKQPKMKQAERHSSQPSSSRRECCRRSMTSLKEDQQPCLKRIITQS